MEAAGAIPTVTVILATYNWTSVLRYAIRTVLWQTFTDFELLVVGDGCTDATQEVVASFGDRRIRWHNLPQNTGNQAGPNAAGLRLACGEFVAYMHQDDLWLPDHLAVLVNAMRSNETPLAHTLLLEVAAPPERWRRLTGLANSGSFGPERIALRTPAVMHRRADGLRVGGWRDWRELREAPYADFLKRVIGPNQRFTTVLDMTVVKFHSGQRRNSYMDQPCAEQAEYFERIRSEPEFRYRELLLAVDAAARGNYEARLISDTPADAPPGWEIEQLRRVRGLPQSDLGPSVQPPESTAQQARVSTSIRNRASRFLTRIAGKVKAH